MRAWAFHAICFFRQTLEAYVAARKKGRTWLWIGLAVFVVLAGGGFAVARMASGSAIDPSKLGKVGRGDIARSVVATGKITPIFQVEVKSKASGIVEKLYVDINDRVHRGQPLAQLDQQEIKAEVAAQRAQLEAAQANVSNFEASLDQDKVNASAPDLPMYKVTLDRNTEMVKEGLVPQQSLDNANRDYLAALNKRDTAHAQFAVDGAKLKQAKAQVAQSQATLNQLEEQLSYTTITAPMDLSLIHI